MNKRNISRKRKNRYQNAHINQNSRLTWSTINEICGRKKTNTGQIKARNTEEPIKLWKDHFVNLLGQPIFIENKSIVKGFDGLPIKADDFSIIELNDAIKSMKNNAAGLDEIPAEVWKTGCLDDQLLIISKKNMMEMLQTYG